MSFLRFYIAKFMSRSSYQTKLAGWGRAPNGEHE